MALCQTTATPITAATMIARRRSAGTKQQEQLPAILLVWDLRIIVSRATCLGWNSSRLLQRELCAYLVGLIKRVDNKAYIDSCWFVATTAEITLAFHPPASLVNLSHVVKEAPIDTHSKALKINLDPRWYGTFAEIGAGQEVVRWFFRVGGAAGTVAKSMSAYDMKVSDAIYGHADRYVSRNRLQAMLDREFDLDVERLGQERADTTSFFALADTVVARSYRGTNECHGWMGIKFQ